MGCHCWLRLQNEIVAQKLAHAAGMSTPDLRSSNPPKAEEEEDEHDEADSYRSGSSLDVQPQSEVIGNGAALPLSDTPHGPTPPRLC